MSKLTIILGAGFSFPAGMPLANDIRARFDRDQKEKLLQFSSGEWMWIDDKRKDQLANGYSYDKLAYSYIINEIVIEYNDSVEDFDNYEVFFAYIMEKFNHMDWFETIYKRAEESLIKDKPYLVSEQHSHYLDVFKRVPYLEKLSQIINYLISDMLEITDIKIDEAFSKYKAFLDYISKFDEVDIFTLNHDVLLEGLLDRAGLEYSRGFTTANSEIQYETESLSVFKNDFSKKIRIHKLHGSLDYFRFEHYSGQGKMLLQPTGRYNYFTTNNYHAKHYATRIDPKTKEVLQDMNFDITPKFITGTNKTDIIDNDIMYSQLLQNFKEASASADTVLISGYSFGDPHINEELQKHTDLNIINQNPYVDYEYPSKSTIQLISLDELDSL